MTSSRISLFGALALMILLQLPLGGFLVPGSNLGSQVAREGLYWLFTAAVIGYVCWIEKRPMRSIGLKAATFKSVGIGAAAAVVMILAMALIYLVVLPALHLGTDSDQINTVQALPLWFQSAIFVRAAVFEEIFYRGFVIERLTELTGRRSLAALISLGAFTFAHLGYWGWAHLIVVAVVGAILTALYLWRRDLTSNMIAHFLTDAVGFLLA
jgi:membrane protease YdiL (CAAX protease family)